MTFILAPNSVLSMAGMVSICEPTPEPPTVNSCSSASCQVLMRDVCQAMQIAVLASRLPIQLMRSGSNFRSLDSVKRGERHARMHQSQHGAVLGRDRVEIVHGANAAGAGHVLDDDAGIARDVLAQERRKRARVAGVTTARIGAEDPRDLAALVEVVAGAGRGWRENRKRHGAQ